MAKANAAQMQSKSYRLPIEDTDFILRDEMRAFRFGMEYSKAELVLRDWGIRSTVVVFGSARVPAPDTVTHLLASAKDETAKKRIQQRAALAPWYDEARKFAKIVSERGGALKLSKGHRDNVIATGGGPGIMEAANRGASDVDAPSIGFNITLALFPGGFGTLDELFEILTLLQTEKMPALPVVMFGRDYWRRVINFDTMIEAGTIEKRDLDLFTLVDTAEEGWKAISRNGNLKRKIVP
jgi:predicted Rossmann-fold nucleotide-binding protein